MGTGAAEPPRPVGRRLDPGSVGRLLEPAGDGLDDARRLLRDVLDGVPVVGLVHAVVDDRDELRTELDYATPALDRLAPRHLHRDEQTDRWRRQVGPAARADVAANVLEQWREGVARSREDVWFQAASGARIALALHHVFDHEARRLYSFALDVTASRAAQQALEDNEQLLRAIMTGSPDLIVVSDLDGRCLFVSDSAVEQLGLDPETAAGERLLEWLLPDDVPAVLDATRRLVAGEEDVTRMRVRGVRADGEVVVFDAQARVLRRRDGRISGLLALIRDVRPELAIEAGLRAARDEAQRANRARDAFLSRMSHELRTPLNAVLGFAQLLEGSVTDERDLDSVDHIRRAGAHLLRLLDEVLDLARIESGSFSVDVAPVALADAVSEALAFVRPLARAQGIRIDEPVVAGDAWVTADRPRLLQVLLNLLSNAVKFNRPEGRVAIDVMPTYDGSSWSVAVSDTGPGMTEAEQARLFVPFERLDADDRGITGTGIGLVLSRSLAERMGGSVSVRSGPGQGSTFTVHLPRVEPEAADPGVVERRAGGGSARHSNPLRILYVEDNAANRDLIRQAIAAAGADQLELAPTGGAGVAAARSGPPDVVLLDLHLPDMDGVEVMHQIRALPGLGEVPVVVISADATRRQIARVLDQGANHYLTKPIDLAELHTTLDHYRG